MNWTASDSASWLSVSPASGTNGGTVTVTPSITGLAAGTYTTDITVTAPGVAGSPKTIPVTLDGRPADAARAVGLARACRFGGRGRAQPGGQDAVGRNTGGGSMDWTASETRQLAEPCRRRAGRTRARSR